MLPIRDESSAIEPSPDQPTPMPDGRLVWQIAEHLTFEQAKDMLDWLEGRGVVDRFMTMEEQGKVTVRWAG